MRKGIPSFEVLHDGTRVNVDSHIKVRHQDAGPLGADIKREPNTLQFSKGSLSTSNSPTVSSQFGKKVGVTKLAALTAIHQSSSTPWARSALPVLRTGHEWLVRS